MLSDITKFYILGFNSHPLASNLENLNFKYFSILIILTLRSILQAQGNERFSEYYMFMIKSWKFLGHWCSWNHDKYIWILSQFLQVYSKVYIIFPFWRQKLKTREYNQNDKQGLPSMKWQSHIHLFMNFLLISVASIRSTSQPLKSQSYPETQMSCKCRGSKKNEYWGLVVCPQHDDEMCR